MTNMTTEAEALAELIERATALPWEADRYSEDEEGCAVIAVHPDIGLRTPTRGEVAWCSTIVGAAFESPGKCEANAALIVAAVNALPALLAERAALVADARRYQQIREGLSDWHGDVYAMVFAPDGDCPIQGNKLDEAIDAIIRRRAATQENRNGR